MKIKLNLYMKVFMLLSFMGCSKDYYDPNAIIDHYFIKDIPKGFDWSTISKTDVKITPDDSYGGTFFYTVEIFDSNPLAQGEDARAFVKGVCKTGQPFTSTVIFPSELTTVFVCQTSPNGGKNSCHG